jgi:hypothetical protein
MVDAVKKGYYARSQRRNNKHMNMAKNKNTSEIVAYHKIKRKFLDLLDMQNEDPDQLEIYEFTGEDFELVAN